MRNRNAVGLGLVLLIVGTALLIVGWLRGPVSCPLLPFIMAATPTQEPLLPTRTPTPAATLTCTPSAPAATPALTTTSSQPTVVSSATSTPVIPSLESPIPNPESLTTYNGRLRWGVGVVIRPISRYPVAALRLGWYLDWRARMNPPRPEGVEYVQMVRLKGGTLRPDAATVAAIARAHPGSLWLIGNEPDVKWQDNVEPAAYARLYHEAYSTIKAADPTARVAIGGVSQPTPLRMRYLEAVLTAYREQFGAAMPVDVWNVHNFILREERGSWGVDIPPGLPDDRGALYEIDDSGNLAIFRQQIWDFRRWMAAQGYGGWPLIVSEYGIPMPEDYGFPPERVVAFLRETFAFFLTAADPALGDPADGYRLVQRWCWYSLDDTTYPTGRLFDPQTGEMTAVGEGWKALVASEAP